MLALSARLTRWLQGPFFDDLFEVETLHDGRNLIEADGRGVASQAACQLCWGRVRVADQGQQGLDHRGFQTGHETGAGLADAAEVGLALSVGHRRLGVQVEEDAIAALALDALASHGGKQAGVGRQVRQGSQFLVGPAGVGLADKAGDGGGQAAVARESGGVEAEEAALVKAAGVGEGVEAAVVVVAAQIGDGAQVAGGGDRGGRVEGGLQLPEGERGRTGLSHRRGEPTVVSVWPCQTHQHARTSVVSSSYRSRAPFYLTRFSVAHSVMSSCRRWKSMSLGRCPQTLQTTNLSTAGLPPNRFLTR